MEPPRGLKNGLGSSKSSNGVPALLLSDSSRVASRFDLASASSRSAGEKGCDGRRVWSEPVPGRDASFVELERRRPTDCFRFFASRGSSVGLRERPTRGALDGKKQGGSYEYAPLRTSPSSSLASRMLAGRSSPAMLAPMPLSTHSSAS
jgi:hypothetical protein